MRCGVREFSLLQQQNEGATLRLRLAARQSLIKLVGNLGPSLFTHILQCETLTGHISTLHHVRYILPVFPALPLALICAPQALRDDDPVEKRTLPRAV